MGLGNLIDLKDLFNKPEYSDLTIKLNDSQEYHVHKFIVCARNDYFLKLCGPDSHFAESKQKIIELKDDDPTALEQVLLYLYGFELPPVGGWRFWLNLHVTADKYLIPELSAAASGNFCYVTRTCVSADDIFDIVETIRTDMSHNEEFVELAAKLREKNLTKLLSNERFRAQLDSGGKEALWQQLDEMISKVFDTDKEKWCTLCPGHTQQIFNAQNQKRSTCWGCSVGGNYGRVYSNNTQVARKAWIED